VIYKNLKAGVPISVPTYESLRTREDRDFNINFFNRTSRTLGSARTGGHVGSQGDSTIITPSFASKTDEFYTSLKQADRSQRTLQEEAENELTNSFINFSEQLNQLSADFLFGDRSSVNGVTIGGAFNATLDAFEISEAASDNDYIQATQMVMDLLKYQGMELDYYCDSISFKLFQRLNAQGSGNSINTQYQFNVGKINFIHMGEINAAVAGLGTNDYTKGFWIVVPRGMAVCMDWIPKQNRLGVRSQDIGGVAEYGSLINPIDGTLLASHKYWSKADTSGTNGGTQDVKEEVQLSVDVSFESAPLTTANETVCQAFAIIA
ncbi:MAG: hypothetical protein HRU26_02560, partial [Psychroserpens sp.]|nr:hypothetical protein [Psychroserpens sp.]